MSEVGAVYDDDGKRVARYVPKKRKLTLDDIEPTHEGRPPGCWCGPDEHEHSCPHWGTKVGIKDA